MHEYLSIDVSMYALPHHFVVKCVDMTTDELCHDHKKKLIQRCMKKIHEHYQIETLNLVFISIKKDLKMEYNFDIFFIK